MPPVCICGRVADAVLFDISENEHEPMIIRLKNGDEFEIKMPKIGFIKRFISAISVKDEMRLKRGLALCMRELLRDSLYEKGILEYSDMPELSDTDVAKMSKTVAVWIKQTSEKAVAELPRLPEKGAEDKKGFECRTGFEKLVCGYTGLNMLQVDNLRLTEYLAYLRDAYIYSLMQTESGREQLEDAWYLMQEEMDIDGVRKITEKR